MHVCIYEMRNFICEYVCKFVYMYLSSICVRRSGGGGGGGGEGVVVW